LEAALLFGADAWRWSGYTGARNGLTTLLRTKYRPSKVTREGRPKLRHAAIVSRQAGNAVGGRTVLRGIELFWGATGVPRLECVDQCAAYPDAGDQTKAR
jgi:hypothetical protein